MQDMILESATLLWS